MLLGCFDEIAPSFFSIVIASDGAHDFMKGVFQTIRGWACKVCCSPWC